MGLNGSGPVPRRVPPRAAATRSAFVERLIVPQASAVWSADPRRDVGVPGQHAGGVLRQPRDVRLQRAGRTGARWRAARRATWRRLTRPVRRAPAALHARAPDRAPRRRRGGHAGRRRARALRRGDPGHALGPGARRCSPTRAAPRREVLGAIPYQRERGGAAHRPLAAAAAPARLGELELPSARSEPVGPDDGDVPHEPPPDARADREFCVTLNRSAAMDPETRDPRHALRPPGLHAGRAGRAGALGRGERRAAHALLRRLLGLRLPRGRRGVRAARVRALRERACYERERPVRGLGQPPAPRAGGARVPLPDLPELPRPGRAARGARPRAAVVGAAARARLVPRATSGRPASAPQAVLDAWRSTAGGPGARAAAHPACAPSGTCSTRSASTTASTRPASRWSAVVAEVTNTPWGERHTYALRAGLRVDRCPRSFHVSPFLGDGRRLPTARLTHARRAACGCTWRAVARRPCASSTRRWRSTRRELSRPAAAALPAHDRCAWWPASTRRRCACKLKGAPYHPHPAR